MHNVCIIDTVPYIEYFPPVVLEVAGVFRTAGRPFLFPRYEEAGMRLPGAGDMGLLPVCVLYTQQDAIQSGGVLMYQRRQTQGDNFPC